MMSFLCGVAWLCLRDRVRTSDIYRNLRVEPLVLHVDRSLPRWFGHLNRCLLGASLWRFSGHIQQGGDTVVEPELT